MSFEEDLLKSIEERLDKSSSPDEPWPPEDQYVGPLMRLLDDGHRKTRDHVTPEMLEHALLHQTRLLDRTFFRLLESCHEFGDRADVSLALKAQQQFRRSLEMLNKVGY